MSMETVSTVRFSDEALQECKELIAHFPEGRHKSALLPILHIAQAQNDGWLSPAVMDRVAEIIGIQPIEVYEVASFYSMFHLEPTGKCILEVCHTVPCWLKGSDDIVRHISDRLGIRPGETTPDGMFSLKTVECLGSCGTAPMLQCGAKYYENLTVEKTDALIDALRAKNERQSYTDRN